MQSVLFIDYMITGLFLVSDTEKVISLGSFVGTVQSGNIAHLRYFMPGLTSYINPD